MSDHVSSPILQPVTIGDLHLKNRIVTARMTRSRSDDAGIVPDYAADYYAQRSGAGLIVHKGNRHLGASLWLPPQPRDLVEASDRRMAAASPAKCIRGTA